jgi:Zn-dependent protease/predicted transcriptional regulator
VDDSLSLGRIAGIKVGLNWSLLIVVALIAWSLASGFFPSEVVGRAAGWYWAAGVTAAILFIASLLAHELAHSVVARRLGVQVDGITLWLFGGVSRLSGDAPSGRAEALIAAVGPITSLVLAGLFFLAGLGLSAGRTPGLAAATANWLGGINVILAVFNLLPAFPLDGGRVLRALIWSSTGDRLRATRIAARVGMGFAVLLIALGVIDFMLSGNVVGGLWLVFLGWFLLSAARAEESSLLMRTALDRIAVGDVMTRDPVVAPDYITVAELLDRFVFGYRHTTFPTQDLEGRLTGLVTLPAVKKVQVEARASTRVRDIACPMQEVPTVAPEDSLVSLLERLGRGCSEGRALVVRGGKVVGIVSPSDVSRTVQAASLRGAAAPAS